MVDGDQGEAVRETWEVKEGAYTGMDNEYSVWPVNAKGNGDKRIACWILTKKIARLIAAAPELLEACKAVIDRGEVDSEIESKLTAAVSE